MVDFKKIFRFTKSTAKMQYSNRGNQNIDWEQLSRRWKHPCGLWTKDCWNYTG